MNGLTRRYRKIKEIKNIEYIRDLLFENKIKNFGVGSYPSTRSEIWPFVPACEVICANNLFLAFNPCVYSIDFMFDRQRRPWIIELNFMPGLFIYPGKELMMKKMYKELIKIFRSF